jgi:alpha-glucosidase
MLSLHVRTFTTMWIRALLLPAVCAGLSSHVWAEDLTKPLTVASPGGKLQATFRLAEGSRPGFDVGYGGTSVASVSLGLEFKGTGALREKLQVVGARRRSHDETYAIPVGKASSARDRYEELIVSLEEATPPRRRFDLALRVFDDGVAFRYLIPAQEALADFVLTDELSRFSFPADPEAHILPLNGYTTPYEGYYETMPVSAIGAKRLLALPMLLECNSAGSRRFWIAVTEANLTDYAGMYLSGVEGQPGMLAAKLSPLPNREDGAKVVGKAPHASPWRVLMVADDPGRFLESNLIFDLNDPCAIADTTWIKPGKTTFPWWNGYAAKGVNFSPGVNTATMKYYIDFCAEEGIPYHSLDGLDIAWYGGPIQPSDPTDVTKAAPSIDMPELLRYAKARGVRLRLWMHWKVLKPQIDEAFRVYESWGIEGVMVDFMDRDDQEMVRFYHEMADKAAKHHLTLTLHGAYKPTGMERTWPNLLTSEAALNQEYNKWEGPHARGTPPEHNLDIAFIRMIAGPLDYHQGGMRSELPERFHFRDKAPFVQGTRGQQLAMFVVYLNHLPMLADDPGAYRGQAGLEFLTHVPTTWDETRVLRAEVGECIVVARRSGNIWYLGGMTAPARRELALPLEFLGPSSFEAELYLDNPGNGPTALERRTMAVSSSETLPVSMPPAGGFVARLKPRP